MSRIVHTDGVLGGEPRLEDRRVSVIQVADLLLDGDHDPAYVADQLDLSLAELHTAMAYYYDHPEEIARIRQRHAELESELASESSARDLSNSRIEWNGWRFSRTNTSRTSS
ncbi:MAG: DUF433 domain-containing protein [Halobacteriales archaeon]|nr:DUF433 domain-containing protein [Halobacteriales archaeon]